MATKKKHPRQTNVSVYIASDPKDPKVELLELTCAALGKSNSELFRTLFISYLKQEGLLDKNEKPVQAKIAELKQMIKSADSMPKLFNP